MKLSTPIPVLKRYARMHARNTGVPHTQALDLMAQGEGFRSWSQLAAYVAASPDQLYRRFEFGDLVLLGARPGQGKTLLALRVLQDAIAQGARAVFFTLEYTPTQVLDRLRYLGIDPQTLGDGLVLDTSDAISAAYIADQTANMPSGTCVVVDYLQLLDQKRDNPPLAVQVAALRSNAQVRGHVVILISQIDRSYDGSGKSMPDLADVRLPNPFDTQLFTKTCFLHEGEIKVSAL